MNNHTERIKRRLPAGYDQLFGRDDYAIDDELRDAGRPPTVRPGQTNHPG